MSDPRFFRKYLDIIDEQEPQVTPEPQPPVQEPHPVAKVVGALRMLNNLKDVNSNTFKNAAAQELNNVLRSEQDPSSKNVSIIYRLFGKDK